VVRLLIMSAALCAAPSTGQWVLKSGEVVHKPCPSALQMSDKARLPQGCVARQAGVWLSRKTYTRGELDIVRLQQTIEAAAAREAVLAQRVRNLEMQLRLTTVAGVCPPCNCTSQIFTTTAVTAAVTTGVCLWTQYQSRR
jgi:hypothetical protein